MRTITFKSKLSFNDYLTIILFDDKTLIYTNTGDSLIAEHITYDVNFYTNIYEHISLMEKRDKSSFILRQFASRLYDYIHRFDDGNDFAEDSYQLLSHLSEVKNVDYEIYHNYSFTKVYFKLVALNKDFEKQFKIIDTDYAEVLNKLKYMYSFSEQKISNGFEEEAIESFIQEVAFILNR